MFAWRLLINSLATNHNVARRLKDRDPSCTFCDEGEETNDHLFLHCPLARVVWFASPFSLRMASNDLSLSGWLNSFLCSNDLESFKMASHFCWALRKERNGKIFRQMNPDPTSILRGALMALADYNMEPDLSSHAFRHRNREEHKTWVPPTEGNIRINFDGSYVDGVIGAATIARDYLRGFLGALAARNLGESPLSAKASSFNLAIDLALAICPLPCKVEFEGACEDLINSVNGVPNEIDWKHNLITDDLKNWLVSLKWECIATHIFRQANHLAHSLADYSLSMPLSKSGSMNHHIVFVLC